MHAAGDSAAPPKNKERFRWFYRATNMSPPTGFWLAFRYFGNSIDSIRFTQEAALKMWVMTSVSTPGYSQTFPRNRVASFSHSHRIPRHRRHEHERYQHEAERY